MIDAHTHLNFKASDPWSDYEKTMRRDNIDRSVLILNTLPTEGAQLTLNHIWRLCQEDKVRLAAILNYRQPDPLAFVRLARDAGIPLTIGKLHPRITNICRKDFPALVEQLLQAMFKTIIIDCFVYGHHIENHIGMELAIYLAQQFPQVNFVLAHAGGCRLLETMLCTRTLANLYYDYSLSCCYFENTSVWLDMVHMLKFNSNRVMFGSDYPDFTPSQAKDKMLLLAHQANLSREQMQLVMGETAQALYWG